eukprot:4243418-Pleurochrysis_carterae.AAC.3
MQYCVGRPSYLLTHNRKRALARPYAQQHSLTHAGACMSTDTISLASTHTISHACRHDSTFQARSLTGGTTESEMPEAAVEHLSRGTCASSVLRVREMREEISAIRVRLWQMGEFSGRTRSLARRIDFAR